MRAVRSCINAFYPPLPLFLLAVFAQPGLRDRDDKDRVNNFSSPPVPTADLSFLLPTRHAERTLRDRYARLLFSSRHAMSGMKTFHLIE